jgi:CRISPR system Cascade subunit CasA
MNLLNDPWIPVRSDDGMGEFRLLTLEELLCTDSEWWVSIPRDDVEMACIQLLVCMVQVMLMPREEDKREADKVLLDRIKKPLSSKAFNDRVAYFRDRDWFNLDHKKHPFMQTRGVQAAKITPIQKLLIGLPEGNNHAFFNEVGEVQQVSGPIAAIALFNQSSNTQCFGGGFKGNLRGGTNPYLAPITTIIIGKNIRDTIWRNVVTMPRLRDLFGRTLTLSRDKPTWVEPIGKGQNAAEIGLIRGLFWQPVRLELIQSEGEAPCDLLGGQVCRGYSGFKMEQATFKVDGLWPHPHGVRLRVRGQDKFVSFSFATPAWTYLSEFLVPTPWSEDAPGGSVPAASVSQAAELWPDHRTQLMVGGYITRISSVIERRHEMFSLADGWTKDRSLIKELVAVGKDARSALRSALLTAAKGHEDKKRNLKIKGFGTLHKKDMKLMGLPDIGERMFYSHTETLFHETIGAARTFKERQSAKTAFCSDISKIVNDIYEMLTNPYAMKPEFIPIIAWSRRNMDSDLGKLVGGGTKHEQKQSQGIA